MGGLEGAIAATRFGMGARGQEISEAASDPRGWLRAQIRPEAALITSSDLLSTRDVLAGRVEAYASPVPGAGTKDDAGGFQKTLRQQIQRETREGLQKEVEARLRQAASTPASFAERWVRFWSNHFTVAARNAQLIGLVGPFEREAIRPYVFSSFAELLRSAALHPGMLVYLDAARSIGPSTQAAMRRNAGLNENLAREILELHTLGVDSGYTQDDIIAFARALTGWTVGGPQAARLLRTAGGRPGQREARMLASLRDQLGRSVFIEALHEPGDRIVMGRTYDGPGKLQAPAILDDLAHHPATARHVALKLARHFVADDPPAAAIARLEAAFVSSQGDLAGLARVLIDLDEAWGARPAKFKTPEELLVSAARAAGAEAAFGGPPRQVYASLAQQPFSAPSPAGWPDDTASWSGPDAIKKRLEWANAVSRRMARSENPSDFLERALGSMAGERTRQAVARAESAEQGFTIALMSPEFQRR